MAISIPRKLITAEISNVISDHLTFEFSGYQLLNYSEENKEVGEALLPLYFGRKLIESFKLDVQEPENHQKVRYKFKGELRDYQKTAVKDGLDIMQNMGTLLYRLHTGAGKSILGAFMSKRVGLRTLVVTHRKPLAKQWLKTFSNHTEATVSFVGVDKCFETDVIVSLDQGIRKIPENVLKSVGLLIVDEAHCFCTENRMKSLFMVRPRFLLMETATPDKLNGMGQLTYSFVGKENVVNKEYFKNFPVKCYHTGVQPTIEKTWVKGEERTNWHIYIKSLYYNDFRNLIILHLILENPDEKILILTGEKKHVDVLFDLISPHKKCSKIYGNMTEYSDCQVLIGTMSKIGTGFDEENFCADFSGEKLNMMIYVSSTKDPNVFKQNFGRVTRSDKPMLVCLQDDASISKNHWQNCRNVVVPMGGLVDHVHFSEKELKHISKLGK